MLKESPTRSFPAFSLALLALLCAAVGSSRLTGQAASTASQPPASGEIFPLKDVHPGLRAIAWTVFRGSQPEPMEVEILGVMRGARGPGQDMVVAQLHGSKPEYTGVVAGMSGSPVYVGNRLLGSISYRIGQFSKDPIAGITPIEQMLEVRDLPVENSQPPSPGGASLTAAVHPSESEDQDDKLGDGSEFKPIETPILMSGFSPAAIRMWKQKMAGTGLDLVMTGGASGGASDTRSGTEPSAGTAREIVPGAAVSAQLVRGDLEIAATCTVTYVDPKQLLACGHPILQAGQVSLPMTSTEVIATLASPYNAFKIVNTGATIGAFTQDRDSAIRGVFGAKAHMIPMHIGIKSDKGERNLNIEVLDLAPLTPQAVMVSIYQSLLMNNQSTADTSYHVTGSIDLDGYPSSPLDLWAAAGDALPPAALTALMTAERFEKLYSNTTRLGAVRKIDIEVEAIPRRLEVNLENARLVSANSIHSGDTVEVEATLRPWHQPARNVRVTFKLPARLGPGNLRLLISDAGTLDRTMDQVRPSNRPPDIDSALAQAKEQHAANHLYVSLLMPETQAGVEGQTLSALPLSMANALEPLRATQDVNLNGESAQVLGEAPAGGVLSGFQVLYLHVDSGGGIN